jgi:aspartate/methionine/tyrosine aminotransferase
MSKSYGLPGLRIGWLASKDRALLGRLETRKHFTSICSAGPSELIATAALRKGEEIRARNRAILDANLPVFAAFFARHAELFEFSAPQGGCVCFPRYLGADGVEAFTRELLREAGVVLLPASIYRSALGPVPADRFRIGLGRAAPGPALEAFDAYLRVHSARADGS